MAVDITVGTNPRES